MNKTAKGLLIGFASLAGGISLVILMAVLILAAKTPRIQQIEQNQEAAQEFVSEMPTTETTPTGQVVLLEVTAKVKTNISWYAGREDGKALIDAGQSWSKELTGVSDRDRVSLRVTPVAPDFEGEDVTCKLTVDGVAIEEKANPLFAWCYRG